MRVLTPLHTTDPGGVECEPGAPNHAGRDCRRRRRYGSDTVTPITVATYKAGKPTHVGYARTL